MRSQLTAALLLLGAVMPASAQIGFQATLETPPSFVSPYDEASDRFSAALYPKSCPLLSSRLKRRPQLVHSSFDESSLRFNTEYYKRGGVRKWLVPVSVDALGYLDFRKEKTVNDRFLETTRRSIAGSDRRGRSGGLGFSVNLPKRLDRIFGEGGAGLKVSGFRRITFSGRSQWTDAAESETFRQSKFPSLNMEQISRFDIAGTIGTKISVKVSQDSQTDIPLANRIQIRYKGDDDDILRTIEAGNTTLSLPNTQFVGYSTRIRGLFGIKAEAQVGNLRLIGIASQEKGSTERTSFTATGEENAQFARDYDYAQRRIFDLGLPGELDPRDSIMTLFIYESVTRQDDIASSVANLWVDPDPARRDACYPSENVKLVNVNQLPQESYEYHREPDRGLHYVYFTSNRSSTTDLGYQVVVRRFDPPRVDTIGDLSNDTLDLKLLSLSESKASPDHQTWRLMWRNCYTIPRSVAVEDIDVKVFKGLPGSEGRSSSFDYQESSGQTVRYLEILGLDQYNSADRKAPDNLLDDRMEVFRPDWGLVIFPHRTPFNSDTTFTNESGVETPKLEEKVPSIYNYLSWSEKNTNSKYYLQMTTKTRSNIIRLGRANIIEGSEKVTLNGKQLIRGTDYNIQYDFGQITLTTDEASDPNADINIDYEYAPFFAVQKKSLLGMRAEYEWSKDLKFGTTFLYKSDKAQERKPRVGQETARAVVVDADASLKLRPGFITQAVDALPLIETEAPSNISISAEVAQSRPNPNVNDIAYVDDFESALDQLSLGTSRTRWKKASMPLQLDTCQYERGQILWHTPRELVRVEDVYDREARQGEGTIRTLRMVYRPKNWRIVEDTVTGLTETVPVRSWAGVIRYYRGRVDAKRAQLFEVRAKGSHGKLHFDFGKISEDVNGNGIGDSEDNYPRGDQNGAVDENEDVGLDGLPDENEPGWDADTLPDPNGDNWYFQGEGKCPVPGGCGGINWDDDEWYYEFLNGTEGNMRDPSVLGVPDKEALSISGFGTVDAYYSFELDFGDPLSPCRVEDSERKGWWTYRIPVRDTTIGASFVSDSAVTPSWDQVNHVRVWFESDSLQTTPDTIEIANWYFVQSNWQDSVIYGSSSYTPTSFFVGSVSEEDNTSFSPPEGVEAYKDPTTNVEEAQRALLLHFDSLDCRDTCLATKDLMTVDRYSGYRNLEMYVYGNIAAADVGKITFFFRIGKDPDNYYEYNAKVDTGWHAGNHVNMDFNDITALKDHYLRRHGASAEVDTADGHYRVIGRPNVNEVRYFAAGVVVDSTVTTEPVSGEIWLDELRVTHVRKDVGMAGRVTVNGNLADLITYNFSLLSKDPYFRGLSSATRGGSANNLGSGRTETRYNYGVSLNLDKFLPRSWGARLPVAFSYAKSTLIPLLRSNSDIVLPEETRKLEQEVSESRSVTVSESFNRPGRNPLFSLLLNRLKSSFSYRRTSQRTVNRPYSFGENYNAKADFDFGIKSVPTVPVFFWTKYIPILRKTAGSRLSLYPDRWKTSANFSRNLTLSDDVGGNRRSSIKRDFTGRMDMNYRVFDNLTASYGFDTRRDLSDLDLVNFKLKDFKLGLETRYGQRFNATYDPKLLNFLTSSFSYKATYSDDWERSTKSRRSAMSRTTGVNGRFDHNAFLGGKGRSVTGRGVGRRGGVSGGRRDVRRGGEAKEETGRKKPFYDPPLALLRLLTGWINPISYSYSESFNNSVPGMAIRPDWKYRMGLSDNAGVRIVPENTRPRSSSEGQGYDFSSGFSLFGGIVTDVKYKEGLSRDLIKQGPRYESKSTSWPDLNIRIQKFKSLPFAKDMVNKFIEVFSPRTGYSRQRKQTKDIDGGFVTSRTTTISHNPLLSVGFNLLRSLSLSASLSLSKNNAEKFNPSNGEIQSETVSTKRSFALTTRYSFTSPGGISLPLFGKLKFRSTMNIDMNVKMNSDKSETSNNGGPFRASVDKSDFSFSPVISYTFSQQIKGGLTLRWQDTKDNYRNRTNHIREVQIWTEIRF